MLPASDMIRAFCGRMIFAPGTPWCVQSAVQRLMRGPKLETVRFAGGQSFDCYTSEKYWWLRERFAPHEEAAFTAALAPDAVFWDIGANIGFWEVALSPRCRWIYAVEPSPRNFARLTRNVQQNGVRNVTLINAAASDQAGQVGLAENGSMSHLGGGDVKVEAIRLDDAGLDPPAAVKIDVEGHAAAVLRGMPATLTRYRPTIFLEIHSTEEESGVRAVLDGIPYRLTRVGRDKGFPYRCRFSAPLQ